jgi:hypothetical protein
MLVSVSKLGQKALLALALCCAEDLNRYGCCYYYLITCLLTTIQLSLGGSSPYTSTDSCHSVQTAVTQYSSPYTSTDSCHSVQQFLHQYRQNKQG